MEERRNQIIVFVCRIILAFELGFIAMISYLIIKDQIHVNAVEVSFSSVYEEEEPYYSSIEEAADYLRKKMVERSGKVTLRILYNLSDSELADLSEEIYEEAISYTGIPDEGDYLSFCVESWDWGCAETFYQDGDIYEISYEISYYTTFEQEEEVSDLLSDFIMISGNTDYELAESIYRYVCNNVDYDYEHKGTNYTLRFTAYAAFIEHTATCQGYSSLVYRLALENGLDCRIVVNPTHAWNMIEIDDEWYFLDATWDSENNSYLYFLQGTDQYDETHPDIISTYGIEVSEEDYAEEDEETESFKSSVSGWFKISGACD